jgi:predicted enzyme related to lactoylglutathione lyase
MAPENTWIWHALIARDPETDAAFYQTVFKYDVFPFDTPRGSSSLLLASGGYARASVNPLPAQRPDIHPYWLGFVRVADVDEAAARAVSLGGRVVVPPHMDRHGGKIAVIADPGGAPLGLMEWSQTAEPGSAK